MFQMVSFFEDTVALLGGVEALGDPELNSFIDFDRLIHVGIPFRAFRNAVDRSGESETKIAQGIGIARTTMNRAKTGTRFSLTDSERVVRLGRILALGKTALGSTRATGRWLLKPNQALGSRVPIELLQTYIGAEQVEAVLGRALLGAYS